MSLDTLAKPLEAPVEVSNEKEDVLLLISKAKAGDDDSYNQLYKKYSNLLHGKYIRKFISSDVDFIEHDDINSIMNLIFVESVNSYDPMRSKFITHLTKQIHFKFMSHYLKERMMPFSNNATKDKIISKLNKTRCILTDDVSMLLGEFSKSSIVDNPSVAHVTYNGQDIEIPVTVLLTSVIPSVTESYPDKKAVDIFMSYVKLILENEKAVIKTLCSEYKESTPHVKKAIEDVTKFITKHIKIKYINTGV